MRVVERGIIRDSGTQAPESRTACYPSLAQLSDGRIFCIFRVAPSKDSSRETVRIAESSDEGKTWTPNSFAWSGAVDGVPGTLQKGNLVETKPGQLMLICQWVNREDPELPIAHPETNGVLPVKLVTFRSFDGGRSWSDIEEIAPTPFPQPELSGPMVALQKEGCFLIPMENQKDYLDPNPIDQKAYVILSNDYGVTWPEWAMMAYDPAYSYWCNRAAVLPESGRVVVLSWTYDVKAEEDLPIQVIVGSPDGKQWSPPHSTGVYGQLSTPFPLDENKLLMGYVHRHQPASIRLRASTDGGLTWNDDNEIVIYDSQTQAATDGLGGDLRDYYSFMVHYTFGWNPMVRLSDGNILMAYFAGSPELISVYSAVIDVSDL